MPHEEGGCQHVNYASSNHGMCGGGMTPQGTCLQLLAVERFPGISDSPSPSTVGAWQDGRVLLNK
jgi:hypothetical protein